MINSFLKTAFTLILLLVFVAVNAGNDIDKPIKKAIRVLLVGGGSSHDFDKWYKGTDVETLQKDGFATVEYTSDPTAILGKLKDIDVLLLANNQPIADDATRKAIFAFVDAGKGLVLAHPALWYNWKDWPEYNQKLVGGGSKGHDKYGPFDVTITKKHPVTKNVPETFHLDDELYYQIPDESGSPIEVLATAKAATSDKVFPSIFIVKYPKGKIVAIALGHDAASHTIAPYQTILRNAVQWAAN
ncbi:ThuA domain-containing protein [Dyadobacter fanqingshengii]|uniref:ThuA domain-containing protein n=1 Tax=Dyadobacter fanqingshengii TaxID=2906443 RepID=A0A9X1P705_9BACT|nr:ThuA domain-containing protein [Dyadobacter fanqingshengii]MCF0039190.1 ThuA domain-containing protein [Dyadobacter fanqingshengii]USJ33991.1 ThuA domain-containing protein [Dyadobacter fanqingshengii]